MRPSCLQYPVLWTLTFCIALGSLTLGGPSSNSTEKPQSSKGRISPLRYLYTVRNTKYPILPPRLRIHKNTSTNSSSSDISTSSIIIATTTTTTPVSTKNSANATSEILFNETIENSAATESTTTEQPTLVESVIRKVVDIFQISSSDNSRSVAWPFPRKPISRRIWSTVSPRPTSRPLPKLLLPKPTRPAMYSLDGFVPKPSILSITTTKSPEFIKKLYVNRLTAKQSPRKQETVRHQQKFEKESRDAKRFENQNKVVSRFTAFARRGEPGKDYPIHNTIPSTNFDCAARMRPGMYADPETGCQIWHMCPGNTPHRYSFLCPNGTIFNENRGVCDWWYNVYCDRGKT